MFCIIVKQLLCGNEFIMPAEILESFKPVTLKELRTNFNHENLFRYIGENENAATIIACSIAVFKGIFRPLFTMMDKKQDPESKKYAAIREGLTEVAAFPLYAMTPFIVGKLVDIFSKQEDSSQKRMKMTAKFIGICAATLIIPAICNVFQPKVMKAYQKHEEKKKAKMGLDVVSPVNIQPSAVINKPAVAVTSTTLQKTNFNANSGMRVGS